MKIVNDLYLAVEQLRDIITGRQTYDSDAECLDNVVTVFQQVDTLTESLMEAE